MAYAGIQTMLLAYKMQKTDKESQLSEISQKMLQETRNSRAAAEDYSMQKGELSKDDPNYEEQLDELNANYKDQLAELAAWEEDLEQQKSDCETEIKLLDGYINSWQSALQANVQKAHSYGVQ